MEETGIKSYELSLVRGKTSLKINLAARAVFPPNNYLGVLLNQI